MRRGGRGRGSRERGTWSREEGGGSAGEEGVDAFERGLLLGEGRGGGGLGGFGRRWGWDGKVGGGEDRGVHRGVGVVSAVEFGASLGDANAMDFVLLGLDFVGLDFFAGGDDGLGLFGLPAGAFDFEAVFGEGDVG